MKTTARIEFGDFQTPLPLAREVCALLRRGGVQADFVIEPTCGQGAFLVAAAEVYPSATLLGWDIDPHYVELARAALRNAGVGLRSTLAQQDFFTHDWDAELAALKGSLLVLGNPPWVTNSAVCRLDGSNLPAKENFLGLRGMAARTGKSNFDVSEWMLIRLIRALRGRPATIAMLCKAATARKVLRFAWQNDGRIAEAAVYRVDAQEHFGASVEACLLLAKTGSPGPPEAAVFDSLSAERPAACIGLAGQDLVADVATYRRLRHLEGLCPYQWRSGIKHDCAAVMELRAVGRDRFRNGLGEEVELEADCLFPLLKCSDLANGRCVPERLILVPQQRVGDDTTIIASTAPRTWSYLNSHRGLFAARKSSIYSAGIPFALFGIGDYAFAPWKVAVSGLHPKPLFVLVPPFRGKPVFFDDASYYASFSDEAEAHAVAEVLNSQPCQRFLSALVFPDTKRPITVELLRRLNLGAIADEAGMGCQWRGFRRVTYSSPEVVPQLELVMETPDRAG